MGVVPASLTNLTFGFNFDQPLTVGVLPATLTHLTFGGEFNQRLTKQLPTGVRFLTLGKKFHRTVRFPPGLQTLTLPPGFPHGSLAKLSGSNRTLVYIGEDTEPVHLRPPKAKPVGEDRLTAKALRQTEWYLNLPRGHRIGNVVKSLVKPEAMREAFRASQSS